MLIALVIMIIWGSSGVFVQGLRQTSLDRHRWNGAEIGGLIMEDLSYSYLSAGNLKEGTYHRYFSTDYMELTATDPYFYDVEWVVRENHPLHGVSHIRLNVYWREEGQNRSVSFETYR